MFADYSMLTFDLILDQITHPCAGEKCQLDKTLASVPARTHFFFLDIFSSLDSTVPRRLNDRDFLVFSRASISRAIFSSKNLDSTGSENGVNSPLRSRHHFQTSSSDRLEPKHPISCREVRWEERSSWRSDLGRLEGCELKKSDFSISFFVLSRYFVTWKRYNWTMVTSPSELWNSSESFILDILDCSVKFAFIFHEQ